MEMLNNSVTAGVILNAVSLSILAEMSSCPLAFVVSSVESRLYTSSSVHRKSVGQLLGELCGRSLSVSPGRGLVEILHQRIIEKVCFFKVGSSNDVSSWNDALLAIEGFHHFPKFFLIMGSFLNMRRSSLLPLRWAFLKYRFLFLIS